MDDAQFWQIVDASLRPTLDLQEQALFQSLRQLSPDQLIAFQEAINRKQQQTYNWELWGAAYVILGGCSDDGFEYFQRWLISAGSKIFNAATAHADDLADLIVEERVDGCWFESFSYIAPKVWGKKTGIDAWRDPEGRFPYTGAPPEQADMGEPFDDSEEHLSKRYPKLWKRFGNDPLI